MLTLAERLDVYDALGLYPDQPVIIGSYDNRYNLDEILVLLSDEMQAVVRECLTAFQAIKLETGTLSGEYSNDPAKTRSRIRDRLARVLGLSDFGTVNPYVVSRS